MFTSHQKNSYLKKFITLNYVFPFKRGKAKDSFLEKIDCLTKITKLVKKTMQPYTSVLVN